MAINNSKIYKNCFKNVKYLRLLIYKLLNNAIMQLYCKHKKML